MLASEEINDYFKRMKEDKTMEERTITITIAEYEDLISKKTKYRLLKEHVETAPYPDDDIIRVLLGVEKPPVSRESEGD